MDYGYFRKSRIWFIAWLLVPAMMIFVFYHGVEAYCGYTENVLRQQENIAQMLPKVEERLARTKALIAKFRTSAQADINDAEEVVMALSKTASHCGVEVVALHTTTSAKKSDGASIITVASKSETRLPELVSCLGAVERREQLFRVESLSMKSLHLFPVALYSVETVMQFPVLSSDMKAN